MHALPLFVIRPMCPQDATSNTIWVLFVVAVGAPQSVRFLPILLVHDEATSSE